MNRTRAKLQSAGSRSRKELKRENLEEKFIKFTEENREEEVQCEENEVVYRKSSGRLVARTLVVSE